MNISFQVQLALWAIAVLVSAAALAQYFNFRKKELRLPVACEYDDLAKRLELRQQKLSQLDESAAKAQEIIGESLQKIGEVNERQAWLESQRNELLKVESERRQQELLRTEIKVQQSQLESLSGDLDRIGREVLSRNAQISFLSTQKANLAGEIDSLKLQFTEVTKQTAEKTLTLNAVQNDLNLKGVDLKRLQDQLDNTTLYVGKAKEQFDKILANTDLAKRTVAEIENQRHALKLDCERLKDEIENLKTWKETLTTMLKQLKAEIDRIDPQTAVANRYRDLWEPCKFAPLPASRGQLDENAALERTERYLKSHGLFYPRRVLHAFHTALKTADMSPLVVLAGISGTGKSLLPKRYAEAMGIHFVTLAVQPRWDSPQDLFGFFNHLEGRYKATDLARAMVQFECYNRESWIMPNDWENGREDRMLLVLLDEMNLARVEYYFSEFLSKLETRRDVIETDVFDRAKAEISLDMGSLREDERNIRLYPGRNILFTGTMNEDESTQSLSDKVIDRACVMRFGRPRKLEPASQSQRLAPENSGLTFATWKNWCNASLSGDDERKVNVWVSALNEGMDMLGKPFAHRVHQAILSYAAHYPRINGQDYLKLALADQIEQRILPKLRGLELEGNEEGMEAIRKVIQLANDDGLNTAFEKAMDHNRTGTFLWRGLDRGGA